MMPGTLARLGLAVFTLAGLAIVGALVLGRRL